MRSVLAAVTACLAPLAAFAGAIQDHDFLTVEYEGTVNFIQRWGAGDCRTCSTEIGDKVSGSLRVNLHAVPRDNFPGDAARGEYSGALAEPSFDSKSFVTGYAESSGLPSLDRIQVQDNIFGGRDLFDVVDQEEWQGPGSQGTEALAIIVSSTTFDFIHGDSPLQSFEIKANQLDADEPNFGERVYRSLKNGSQDWFGALVRFSVDSLKATPGRCSAP